MQKEKPWPQKQQQQQNQQQAAVPAIQNTVPAPQQKVS